MTYQPYGELTTYGLLETYGALAGGGPGVITPRPAGGTTLLPVATPGPAITARPATGVTMRAAGPTAAGDYDLGDYDQGDYDATGPGTIIPRPYVGATIRSA